MTKHDKAIEAACMACWGDAAEFHEIVMRRAIAAFLRATEAGDDWEMTKVSAAKAYDDAPRGSGTMWALDAGFNMCLTKLADELEQP